MLTLREKVRQKCDPSSKKSMSKWQKWQPFNKNNVENATPRAEMGAMFLTVPGQRLGSEGAILNPLSLLSRRSFPKRGGLVGYGRTPK